MNRKGKINTMSINVKHVCASSNIMLFYVEIFDENENESNTGVCYDDEISDLFGLNVEEYKKRIKKTFDKGCVYKEEMFMYKANNEDMSDEQIEKIDEEIINKYKNEFAVELTLLTLDK